MNGQPFHNQNTYRHGKAAALGLLLSLLFWGVACEKEVADVEVPEPEYATLVISLGTVNNATPTYTRAVDQDGYIESDIVGDEDDTSYEHTINKWWIVVLRQQLAEGTTPPTYVFDRLVSNSPSANNSQEDSETDVEIKLEIGQTYKFYAFANLEGLKDGTEVKEWIENLSASTNDIENEIQTRAVELRDLTDYNGNSQTTPTAYIPMSSYGYTITIQQPNQSLSIPLIRLLGKVRIEVTNATGKQISIDKLTMGKFRGEGSIYLPPYDVKTGDEGKGNLMVTNGTSDAKLLNPSFPTSTTPESVGKDWVHKPSDADKILEDNADRNFSFYINETGQQNQVNGTSDMTIAVEVSGDGINRDPSPKNTNFFFIRRNDLLEVPILISNAITTIEFDQKRMPIGGLPASVIFESGAIVANRQLTTTYGGDIVISYSLDALGSFTDYQLVYYGGGIYMTGDRYCSAVLEKNDQNLLLEPDKSNKVILGSDDDPYTENAPWLSSADGLYGYHLAPDETSDETKKVKGSFTITAQELAKLGTATIKLTLVAKGTADGKETILVLPYTLTITNGKTSSSSSTGEGGN